VIITGLYLTSREKPIEEQNSWLEPLMSGTGLEYGSPVLALRDFLVRRRKERIRIGTNGTLGPRCYLALYLRAWRAWEQGEEIRNLREPENMPIVGLKPEWAPEPAPKRAAKGNGKTTVASRQPGTPTKTDASTDDAIRLFGQLPPDKQAEYLSLWEQSGNGGAQ
jgi:hypothetical protein